VKTFDVDVTFRITITDPNADPFVPKTKAEVGKFLEDNVSLPGYMRKGMDIQILAKYPD
jgi:hypothetical protein